MTGTFTHVCFSAAELSFSVASTRLKGTDSVVSAQEGKWRRFPMNFPQGCCRCPVQRCAMPTTALTPSSGEVFVRNGLAAAVSDNTFFSRNTGTYFRTEKFRFFSNLASNSSVTQSGPQHLLEFLGTTLYWVGFLMVTRRELSLDMVSSTGCFEYAALELSTTIRYNCLRCSPPVINSLTITTGTSALDTALVLTHFGK
ncbi:hypothetical protein JTB14_010092 [Gonioctena quinquepunctata]|nr:hypothetical protein JTB14_010092 [Gonioctena quinquepunctata]